MKKYLIVASLLILAVIGCETPTEPATTSQGTSASKPALPDTSTEVKQETTIQSVTCYAGDKKILDFFVPEDQILRCESGLLKWKDKDGYEHLWSGTFEMSIKK